MLSILFAIAAIASLISLSKENIKCSIVFIIFAIVFILNSFAIKESDSTKALQYNRQKVNYGQITGLAFDYIAINDKQFSVKKKGTSEKYPLNPTNYFIGDIVKYTTLESDIDNYLIKIEKLDVEEK